MNPLVHIRKKARKAPFGMSGPRYMRYRDAMAAGEIHDPMRETLCGAPPTTSDSSWADTRWAKNIEHVTCAKCITNRTA